MASIALGQAVVAVVLKHGDVFELETLIEHFESMDHRRAVGAVLAQPGARVLGLEQRLAALEGAGVEPLGFATRERGDRIVEQHETDPEQEGDDHCRQCELPHRNAGGAEHDEFGGAAQHQEDADGADQNGEGEDEFGEGWQTQERHPDQEET